MDKLIKQLKELLDQEQAYITLRKTLTGENDDVTYIVTYIYDDEDGVERDKTIILKENETDLSD